MNNYLLNSNSAKRLYDRVRDLPIIDYHNHLSIIDVLEDKRFYDIYDLWIKPDPYKHRAMRMRGVNEKYITGDASDFEKFRKWCEIFPDLIGNPLFVWSRAELDAVFGISELPNAENAEIIYQKASSYLALNNVTARSLLEQFNVELACPCVALADDISFFEDAGKVLPSLRGDDIVRPDLKSVKTLEEVTFDINNLTDYKKAVTERLDEFKRIGCKFSDHAVDNGFEYYIDDGKNDMRFECILKGDKLSFEDEKKLFSYMLLFVCGEYSKRGLTVQLHIGAERYTSTRLRALAGAAGGFAGIGNSTDIKSLTRFLDELEKGKYGLPKIILFALNPSDNAMLSVLSGSYSKDDVPALITQGPAWWWCDHKYGICEVFENLASFGLLSNFIGMTTDSRSFLSFVRHDYFRRILCEWLGEKYDKNELCCSFEDLIKLAEKMCYKNAENNVRRVLDV